MKNIFVFILALIALQCAGQKQTYDLVTHLPPQGWIKEEKDNILSYVITNKKTGGWSRIAVVKSTVSKGSIDSDFESEWKEFAVNQFHVSGEPRSLDVQEIDGWKLKAGAGTFTYNNADAMVVVTTMSGFGRCVSIVSTTNSEEFLEPIQTFISAIQLVKPSAPVAQQTTVNDNFAFHTTNFDNGWTSTVHEDYVLVAKGNIKVYLSYVEKFNASDFSGTEKEARHFYWDNFVSKYFTTGDRKFNNGGALSDFSPDYIEGPATDRQSGESRYIAMILRIIPYTGTLTIIMASATSEDELRGQFPKADYKFDNDLLPMYGYNKFAIGKNDLPGKWVSGGKGASLNWYSTTTGNQVGTTAVAKSDVFNFEAGGKYTSTHNGASGWVGSMNTYQQQYKGNYTVTEWSVTATNRWDGKTDTYNAWFEIVKGGRILHFDSPGITYELFKER